MIDDHITTAADKANNFFIDIHSINRPRAEVVTELLCEMNPDVIGNAFIKNPLDLLRSKDLSYFLQFSLIIISEPSLTMASILPLANYLFEQNIPLILLQVKGLLGTSRLQVREHCIMESHPGRDQYDLYIHPLQTQHWTELKQYINKFKVYRSDFAAPSTTATSASAAASSSSSSSSTSLPQPDGEEHAHIPYIAILGHEIARWQKEHSGSMPKTYDEKQAFKAGIRTTAWNGEEGNFDEAIDFAHRAYELPKFDRYVQEVFDDPILSDDARLKASVNLGGGGGGGNGSSSSFWLLVRAVKDFIANEGHGILYPVSTHLPDMHCKTAYYVELKEIFARKANEDLAAIEQHLKRLLLRLELPLTLVDERDLHIFVRNVRTLRVVRTRSLEEEYGTKGDSTGDDGTGTGTKFQTSVLREILEEEVYEEEEEEEEGEDEDETPHRRKLRNPNNVHWYLALRAADMFHTLHGRIAGSGSGDSYQSDGALLVELEKSLLKTIGLDDLIPEPNLPCLGEIVRSGATEPHVTAAFMGGIASQMALKVLLKQYVPINNTLIWNGVFASSNTYEL